MGAATQRLLGVCAVLIVIAVADIVSGEAASVVVGLAKCADCTRKNMKNKAAFKGLQVAIKCKNSNGDYESKAVGELDGSGAFSVPVAADLHGTDCLAQLHSAAGTPCPGQESSRVVPMPDRTFVIVAGKAGRPSAECASATMWDTFHKGHDHHDFFDHSHKDHDRHDFFAHSHKDHDHHHFFDHFHKTPTSPKPEYQPPMPTYGSPTPIYHPPPKH